MAGVEAVEIKNSTLLCKHILGHICKFQWSALQTGQDSSAYILDIILGCTYVIRTLPGYIHSSLDISSRSQAWGWAWG